MKGVNRVASAHNDIQNDCEKRPRRQSKSLQCSPNIHLCTVNLEIGPKSNDAKWTRGADAPLPLTQHQPQPKNFCCIRSRRATVDLQPRSLHSAATRNHIHDGIEKNCRPLSKSFNCARSDRRCLVHAEVELNSPNAKCQQCSRNCFDLTSSAKESQLNAAERLAEVEWNRLMRRYENEDDGKEGTIHSSAHQAKPITSKPRHKKAGQNFSKVRRSSEPTDNPSRKSFIRSTSFPCSEEKDYDKEVDFKSNVCQFKLGQVADDSDVTTHAPRESLIQIARLKVDEGAFIKRSGNDWTYATLKARVIGDDPHLVFTVNEKGSTKSFPMSH